MVLRWRASHAITPLPRCFPGRYISSVDLKGCLPPLWVIAFLTSLSLSTVSLSPDIRYCRTGSVNLLDASTLL